jgi:hexosaminidase
MFFYAAFLAAITGEFLAQAVNYEKHKAPLIAQTVLKSALVQPASFLEEHDLEEQHSRGATTLAPHSSISSTAMPPSQFSNRLLRRESAEPPHASPTENQQHESPSTTIAPLSHSQSTPHEDWLTGIKTSRTEASSPRLFPLPVLLRTESGCCAEISENITVELASGTESALLLRAAGRAEQAMRELRSHSNRPDAQGSVPLSEESPPAEKEHNQWFVRRIIVSVSDATNESVDENTNWSYRVQCQSDQAMNRIGPVGKTGECIVQAQQVAGALAALQSTLPQIFAEGGRSNFQRLFVDDQPRYPVRGLVVDVGRRFVPKDILMRHVIDGMAFTKMNLLQLHLNDFCRFALELPSFPELRPPKICEGQYSIDDIKEIVAYAMDRGIRIVPEVDLPGHANALRPLESRGLIFCNASPEGFNRLDMPVSIFDDPDGNSRKIVSQLLAETAAAFSSDERWFHIGGNEALPIGQCNEESLMAFEKFLMNDLVGGVLRRTPVVWQGGMRRSGGNNDALSVAWKDHPLLGHRFLEASAGYHILSLPYGHSPVTSFWQDHSNETQLGGLSAMWTDQYCDTSECGAVDPSFVVGNISVPYARVMFAREFDSSFAASLAGMIWPRAGVSGAALWHFAPELSLSDVVEHAKLLAQRLRKVVRVASCPPGCECDELSACGRPYPVLRAATKKASSSNAQQQQQERNRSVVMESQAIVTPLVILERCFTINGSSSSSSPVTDTRRLGQSQMSLEDAVLFCFWQGHRCVGFSCESSNSRSIDPMNTSGPCRLYEQSVNGRVIASSNGTDTTSGGRFFYAKRSNDTWCAPDGQIIASTSSKPRLHRRRENIFSQGMMPFETNEVALMGFIGLVSLVLLVVRCVHDAHPDPLNDLRDFRPFPINLHKSSRWEMDVGDF